MQMNDILLSESHPLTNVKNLPRVSAFCPPPRSHQNIFHSRSSDVSQQVFTHSRCQCILNLNSPLPYEPISLYHSCFNAKNSFPTADVIDDSCMSFALLPASIHHPSVPVALSDTPSALLHCSNCGLVSVH